MAGPLAWRGISALFEKKILTPIKPDGAAGTARFRIDATLREPNGAIDDQAAASSTFLAVRGKRR